MFRRLAIMAICWVLAAVPARAQRTEGSASVGYGANDGISSDSRFLFGDFYDTAGVDSGISYNFTLGVFATRGVEFEFLFARQDSDLSAGGPGGGLPLNETAVYHYMGNVVYNWGDEDSTLRPFVFGGLGATHYAFGEFLLPQPLPSRRFRFDDSETRFASTFGGGLKFYFTRYIGAKAAVRVTPTYVTSTPGGAWCDPFYGCWPITDDHYATQFDASVGVTFRF
jgi:Outer membrane protein beta-barrel domain